MPRRKKPLVIAGDEAAEILGVSRGYLRLYLERHGLREQRGWDPRDIHRLAARRRARGLLEAHTPPSGSAPDTTPTDQETR